jgi:glycosyltransferase involved in cell wall biosynthesis
MSEARDGMDRRSPIAAVVLTFNEEVNLARCLSSVAGWADEIVVVDSFSTDATCEIARRRGATVHQHAYEGHPQQWKWALGEVPLKSEWVFALDADFVVTPELKEAIDAAIAGEDREPKLDGFFVRHRQVFRGRPLWHGTMYPRYWLRLFRRGRVRVDESDLVDLHFYVDGRTGTLEHDVVEDNWKEMDFSFWMRKQIAFAQRQAVEEIARRQGGKDGPKGSFFGTPDRRILWWKERWLQLPLFVRPVLYFLYRYFLSLGFLDGKEGFLYHFSQALVYRIMVDARIEELRRERGEAGKAGEAGIDRTPWA